MENYIHARYIWFIIFQVHPNIPLVHRTKDIQYPIIRQYVEKKYKIVTDEAKVYKNLNLEGYGCETVKFKTEFVSQTGAYTNSVEGVREIEK